MTHADERIRRAYGPVPTDEHDRDRIWSEVTANPLASRPASSRTRAPRMLAAIAVAVVSIVSVAIAQPGQVDNMIGDKHHADRLHVLNEPNPIGTEGLSPMAGHMFGRDTDIGFGSVDPDKLHKVLDYDSGRYSFKLRSGASADGQACLYTEEYDDVRKSPRSATGGCSLSFQYNGHVTVGTQHDMRMGTLVTGLVDDEVTRVRVKLSGGGVSTALLGNNGFLLHIPDPKVRTRGLLVDLKSGRTIDVTMSGCLRSQLVPPRRSNLGCGFGMNKGPHGNVRDFLPGQP